MDLEMDGDVPIIMPTPIIDPISPPTSDDLPSLPFIRSFRRLLKPPPASLPPLVKRESTRTRSTSWSTLSSNDSQVKPSEDMCKQKLRISLKRVDEKQAPKTGASTALKKQMMKQKVVIELTRFEDENVDPQKSKSSVQKTPSSDDHVFSLMNVKVEALRELQAETAGKRSKHFTRNSKVHQVKNEKLTQGKKLKIELRRIDENILFHIKINNPDAVLTPAQMRAKFPPLKTRQQRFPIKQEIQVSESPQKQENSVAFCQEIAGKMTSRVNRALKQLKVETEISNVMAPVRVLRKREGRPSLSEGRKSRKVKKSVKPLKPNWVPELPVIC